jgi:hypothetical protein
MLADNESIYAAAKTIDIALALGLNPCFRPHSRREGANEERRTNGFAVEQKR